MTDLELYPGTNFPFHVHTSTLPRTLSPLNNSICPVFLEAKLPAPSSPQRAPALTSEVKQFVAKLISIIDYYVVAATKDR